MPLTHLVSLASYCLLVGGSGLLTAGSGLSGLQSSHRPVPSHVTQHFLRTWARLPSSFCLSKLPLFSCWTSLSLRSREPFWVAVSPATSVTWSELQGGGKGGGMAKPRLPRACEEVGVEWWEPPAFPLPGWPWALTIKPSPPGCSCSVYEEAA